MKNKIIKVIDEHNIDRNANVMFAVDLNGSEYIAYWIMRDDESNNIFVSKVLKNLDGTYNMLNIDDADKKKEVSDVVKFLISSAVSDENDKLVGLTKTLSNGETAKFINVSFNKEQNINVPKTYITTVKKEVTRVVEDYYDVVIEEEKIENVLSATPVASAPEVVETITNVESQPVVQPVPEVVVAPVIPESPVVQAPAVETPVAVPTAPVVEAAPVMSQPVVQPEPTVLGQQSVVQPVQEVVAAPVIPQAVITQPISTVAVEQQPILAQPAVILETPIVAQPVTQPAAVAPVIPEPVVTATPVVQTPVVAAPVAATPVVEAAPVIPQSVVQPVQEVVAAPVIPQAIITQPIPSVAVEQQPILAQSAVILETPVVAQPVAEPVAVAVEPQPLVFNAAKETNLNAALGEVANSTSIPVENINVVREFGEETPVAQPVAQPGIAPMIQPTTVADPKVLTKKAGFANSKFFMVIAIAFFMASCIFLGYEVFNYFQLTK